MPRAVLCRSLAGRLFGHEAAAGQTILLNGLEYTVSGVVDDVSGITADVYAEAWVTYSSLSVAMDHALGERDGPSACWRQISCLPMRPTCRLSRRNCGGR